MTILVSSAEPGTIKSLGQSSSYPESRGADIVIPGNGFLVGIQRKKFPDDLLSSLSDGRLVTSVLKLCQVRVPLLVLEGKAKWSRDGALVGHDYGQGSRFTRTQLERLVMSLFHEFGVATVYTESMVDTVRWVREVDEWAAKAHHNSLIGRPGPKLGPFAKRRDTTRDWGVYLLQGFEGIGPELAGRIYDHFGRVPLRLDVEVDELLEVKGIGPKLVENVVESVGEVREQGPKPST